MYWPNEQAEAEAEAEGRSKKRQRRLTEDEYEEVYVIDSGSVPRPDVYVDRMFGESYPADQADQTRREHYDRLHWEHELFLERVARLEEQRCRENWLYALLFAYEPSDMDQSFDQMLDFVWRYYGFHNTPSVRPIETGNMAFVRETLQLVRQEGTVTLRKFLMLALLAFHEPIQRSAAALCPLQQFEHFLPYLGQQTAALLASPFCYDTITEHVNCFLADLCIFYTTKVSLVAEPRPSLRFLLFHQK